MKKHASLSLIILLSLFALVLTGCGGTGSNPQIPAIYTGTDGVTIAFSSNNPPQEIYEDSDVPIYAEIWNKGAFSIESANNSPVAVYMSLDPWYFSVNPNYGQAKLTNINDKYPLYLQGKSETWPIGEKTMLPLIMLHANKIVGTRESPTTRIDLFTCSYYKTFFAESVCIDGDVYGIDSNPICKNKGVYSYAGQGAPVIVSSMEVDMVPAGLDESAGVKNASMPFLDANGSLQGIIHRDQNMSLVAVRPSFRIHLTNVGRGLIFASTPGKNPCWGGNRTGDSVRVYAKLGNTVLKCSKVELQMYDNSGTVRCSLPDDQQNGLPFTMNRNYELPLTVQAEYFYMTTTSKEVKIIRTS